MKNVVITQIPRAAAAAVAILEEIGVATAHEAMGRRGLMQSYMRPIQEGAQIAGPAVTVYAQPGDNWMIHVAIEQCQPGDVLVVALASPNTDGMLGDLLGTALQARGVKGVVMDAGCRDVRQLRAMGFPVWSRAISAQGTVKASLGSVNIPVVCAGAAIDPGDVIVADDDGVVVIPRRLAEQVAAAGQQRIENEQRSRERLARNEPGRILQSSRARLSELGLTYFETLEAAGLAPSSEQ